MARFGGNEFSSFSVPLVFNGRYFVLEPGNPALLSVFIEQEGKPIFEVIKNKGVTNPMTEITSNATGVLTVTDKTSGNFLYKIRPGSETSVVFGTIGAGGEVSARVSDHSIEVGGCKVSNCLFDGAMAGVVVQANGGVCIAAQIPPEVLKWLQGDS